MDLYTTCIRLAGAEIPDDRIVDGLDLSKTLFHGWPSPRDHMLFYRGVDIHAVRRGDYKAHFLTRPAFGRGSRAPVQHDPPLVYHLGNDPGEQYDVAAQSTEEVAAIRKLVAEHEAKLVRGENQLTR